MLQSESVEDADGELHIIFYDENFIREAMLGAEVLFVYCTFDVTPRLRGVYQFLTIMGFRYGHVILFNLKINYFFTRCLLNIFLQAIPFFWGLLSRKTQAAYSSVLERAYNLLNRNIISKIMCDFEIGLRNACSYAFPWTKIVGCNFHYDRVITFLKFYSNKNS